MTGTMQIGTMQKVAIIQQQLRDWYAAKFATELQLKTHSRLMELGLGSETTVAQLKQTLAGNITAIDFLEQELTEIMKAPSADNDAADLNIAK